MVELDRISVGLVLCSQRNLFSVRGSVAVVEECHGGMPVEVAQQGVPGIREEVAGGARMKQFQGSRFEEACPCRNQILFHERAVSREMGPLLIG